jgi:hypothetical protein
MTSNPLDPTRLKTTPDQTLSVPVESGPIDPSADLIVYKLVCSYVRHDIFHVLSFMQARVYRNENKLKLLSSYIYYLKTKYKKKKKKLLENLHLRGWHYRFHFERYQSRSCSIRPFIWLLTIHAISITLIGPLTNNSNSRMIM